MTEHHDSSSGSEQDYLEDNIATVAFHLGQPGARLSVSHNGPGLIVDPGEVLKEISRRLGGVAQGSLEISQHIGWLKQYVEGMTADNWRDMQLRAERQLEQLATAVTRPHHQGGE